MVESLLFHDYGKMVDGLMGSSHKATINTSRQSRIQKASSQAVFTLLDWTPRFSLAYYHLPLQTTLQLQ